MNSQKVDLSAPPRLPSDAELEIPRGAEPESAISGPIAGRYDLGERIARGGMGIVYRAHDRLLNRTVAVKVMRGKYMDRPDMLRRFVVEAKINGRLQHPGVVPVYEVGNLPDGRPFIAMKLIEGQTLSRLLRERINPAENQPHFLKVFEALCQTMKYAHQQGVIHRDLKPDNVMVGEFGEVQVMDWGLAKFLDPADAVASTPDGFEMMERSACLSADGHASAAFGEFPTHATDVIAVGPDTPGVFYTSAGEVFGTLAYMPPEQARGEMDRVDRRSDVFSLGAILCQILTGQAPYYGPKETLRDMAREGKLFGANILLDRCGADQTLVILAKHCLGVDPEVRPANAGVLQELVTECLEGLQDRSRQIETTRLQAEARVAEAEAREQLARRARRLARTLAVTGVMVAAMLVTGLGWYANDRLSRNADEQRRRATAIQQIEEALTEAETFGNQARAEAGGRQTRDTAIRQAQNACQRAEALASAINNPPEESVERLQLVKTRIAETEHELHVVAILDQWRVDLFNERGDYDQEAAATRCRDKLHELGIDLSSPDWQSQLFGVKDQAARTAIQNARNDWVFMTSQDREQFHFFYPDVLAHLTPTVNTVSAVVIAVGAQSLIDTARTADAEKLLIRATRQHPNDFNLILQLGRLLHSRHANAESIPYLTAARACKPEATYIDVELGLALADACRNEEAVETLRAAVKTNPQSSTAHTRLADLLVAQRNIDEARDNFAAAVAADPNNVHAQIGLGQTEFARGNLDAAEKAFAAANAKPNAIASAGLGGIHLKNWEASKAGAAFRTAVELEPTNADYRLGLIEALRMSNDSPAAIKEARSAIKVVPNSAAIHRLLADMLRIAGDRPGAIAAFRSTVKLEPGDIESHLRLATLCEAIDDFAGATEALRAADTLRPKDADIQAAIERVHRKTRDSANTVEACRAILAGDPGDISIRHKLGRLLAERGDSSAIDELKKATEDKSASSAIWTDLAEAYLQFGRFRDAAHAFRSAAELLPAESAQQEEARLAARRALRWAGLEVRLPEILSGAVTPMNPSAWADFGEVCRGTNRFAAAARFFASAAEGDEKYARQAAIYAALAGFNRGIDAKELTDEKRAELRKTALAAFKKSPTWTNDRALLVVKDPAALNVIPAAERNEWNALLR